MGTHVLVLYEKHGIRLLAPAPGDNFIPTFVRVIEERLADGNWYYDTDEVVAQNVVTAYHTSPINTTQIERERAVTRFMQSRGTAEYEGWDIVEVEELKPESLVHF